MELLVSEVLGCEMKEITKFEMIKMYWQGLRLKPKRMMGNSGKCNWVVASAHPTYSITWTWALYWTNPKCWKFKYYDHTKERKVFDPSILFTLGFHFSTQDAMLYPELKQKDKE